VSPTGELPPSNWRRLSTDSLVVNTAAPNESDPITSEQDDDATKHLNKLKKFLTTLQQFGFDISAEIGEKVRGLVLALVVSVDDF